MFLWPEHPKKKPEKIDLTTNPFRDEVALAQKLRISEAGLDEPFSILLLIGHYNPYHREPSIHTYYLFIYTCAVEYLILIVMSCTVVLPSLLGMMNYPILKRGTPFATNYGIHEENGEFLSAQISGVQNHRRNRLRESVGDSA